MGIRTTVTLDEDVLARVKEASRSRGISFRETLNDLLRTGLLASSKPPDRPKFRIRASHMGLRPGLNYDSTEALLEYAEGIDHR
jgi:hypothetical protein